MAYDWPAGWNDTRTEKAVQQWICDTMDVPKYAVRCSIDSDELPTHRQPAQPIVQIFHPLTGKRTAVVHTVFGRLVTFGDPYLRVEIPKEKTGPQMYRLRTVLVWTE